MESDPKDPRPGLLSSIDTKTSRIELSNTPIVLLCGGKAEISNHHPIQSLRHAITRESTSYEIFRPEEITSWSHDGVYKNLMNLEADLASICSLVVIILESPGSFTEVGAFSQLPELSNKIIAISSNIFKDNNSFINLGILRHLTENDESSVRNYPWDTQSPQTIPDDVVKDIILEIQNRLDRLTKSSKLNLANSSHVIVLICEIIKLFSALKESEIFSYLKSIDVEITKDELKRKLFLLKEFRLIKDEIYGDAKFFIRSNEEHHKLRLVSKEGADHDSLRITMRCLEYYREEPKQKKRFNIIKEVNSGMIK